ncbi:MAG: hypothetical protein JWP91_308 [Fibrobacteres bacterium]|nr:hypothetical protein [Fibrobacterota bacterium]
MSKNSIKILIIDDSPEDREVLKRFLEEDDQVSYEILEGDYGEQGIQLCLLEKPDCVLLDYQLPDMDGLEVLDQIADKKALSRFPVIMITGSGDEVTAVKAMKSGAFDYLVKERITAGSLKKVIRQALEKIQTNLKLEERTFILKMKNQEMQRLSSKLQKVLESNIMGVFFWNKDGIIIDANAAFHSLLGYGPGELLATPTRWRDLTVGEMDYRNEAGLRTLADTGTMEPYEQLLLHKNGNQVDVYLGFAFLEGPEGESVAFCLDITQRKKFEHALRQSENQLRQSQKMEAVGKLAGGIAHDFNNLLTSITGFTSLSRASLEASHPVQEYLQEVAKAAERAAALTHQLLAYSRKQVIAPKVSNLNDIVSNMDKMLQRVIGEDIDLLTVPGKDLWLTRIDPGQLEQVILNLAINARDAMPKGGKLVIETANAQIKAFQPGMPAEMAPGPYIRLAISDTGAGMSQAIQEQIFEPFFTTKPVGHGTGLGLSMVDGIIKQSGGHILVSSSPGQGASFKIYLPRLPADQEAVEPIAGPSVEAARPGKEAVLVVEDEDTVRRLVKHVLQTYGYNVLEAANGVEAEKLASDPGLTIDLLLTDVIMSHMGGRELAQKLMKSRPGIKVMYMSGYTDDAIVQHGVLESTAYFIQKPFSPQSLLLKIREVLETVEA